MKKLFKFLFVFLFSAIIVAAIAVTVLVSVIDPNDFKDEIAKAIDQKTGRQFEILGNLKWTLFPQLGISASEIRLGNPEGFSSPYFATVGSASLQLRLSALIFGSITTSGVEVVDLALTLERLPNGRTNWEDFDPPAPTQSTFASPSLLYVAASQSKTSGPIDLNISDLSIENAQITLIDHVANTRSKIMQLHASGQNIQFDRPFLAKGRFNFDTPSLTGSASFKGDVGLSPGHAEYSLHDFNITGRTEIPGRDLGPQETLLTLDVAVDLEQDTLELSRCDGELMGHPIEASMSIHNMTQEPVARGDFLLKGLDVGKLSISDIEAKVKTQGKDIVASPITATLYEGTFNGHVTLTPQKESDWQWHANGALDGLSLGEFSRALTSQQALGGQAQLQFSVSGIAAPAPEALQALNGEANFEARDGHLGGFDLQGLFGTAGSASSVEDAEPSAGGKTVFDTLSGSLTIASGELRNSDLALAGPNYTASGKGNLVLDPAQEYLASRLNYTFQAMSPKLSNDLPLAVRVQGPLSNLRIMPDIEAYIQALLKKQLKESVFDQIGLGGVFSGSSKQPPAQTQEEPPAPSSTESETTDAPPESIEDAFKELENIFKGGIFGR